MKSKYLISVLSLLTAGNCFGQIMFQRVISTVNGCGASAAGQTTDGGYIVAGYVLGEIGNEVDMYLIKTNVEGDTLWTRMYGGFDGTTANSIKQTADGGYIIAGVRNEPTLDQDIYVVRADAQGDTLWTRTYGGAGNEIAYSVEQTNDSGFIVAGSTNSFGAGGNDVYLLKINAGGALAWTKMYGGTHNDIGSCVKQTNDSGFIICGYTNGFGASLFDVYLIKTDVNGDTLWTKTYGGPNNDFGYSVQQTADSGYIITGLTESFDSSSAVYLIKTNAGGDTVWTKSYNESNLFSTNANYANNVQQTADGGYILNCLTESGDFVPVVKTNLIKTNASGDTLWTKSYTGFSAINQPYSSYVSQANDGGYIVGAVNNSSVYLIKTDVNGNSGCNVDSINTIVGYAPMQASATQTIVSSGGSASTTGTLVSSGGNDSILCLVTGIHELNISNGILIYPNPTSDLLYIKNVKATERSNLTICNVLGEALLSLPLGKDWGGAVNCKLFSSGVYFVRVANESESWVGRFVKE